jgi:hypothetical integral membrane protein (TIGR02206 family)
MPANLHLFGPVHLLILAAVPLLAASLATFQRKLPPGSKSLRLALAVLLFVTSMMYYGYMAMHGQLMFPSLLPLQLCDLSLWLVILALLTLNPLVFDLAYYPALAGASMSLLTPNLSQGAPAFLCVQFFLDHGLIVVGVLYLIWSRQARPRPMSVARAMLFVNIFAAAVGAFDFIYKTNYMFLRAKPERVSLLDYLGPWPAYILSGEVVGLLLFTLLYLPFRRSPADASDRTQSRVLAK